MAHEIETIAYANETPWHGLGIKVDPTESIAHWVKMAGIDWTVELKALQTVDGDPLPNWFALQRSTDRRILTIAGNKWVPVQNSQMVEFFKNFVAAGGATMETLGSLKGGRIVWGLASLNDKFTVAGKTDVVKGYLLMACHHILGMANIAKVTGVRVVCANTMAMATATTGKIEHRFNHLKAFDPEVAAEAMGLVREDFVKFGKVANQLAKLNLSQSDVIRLLAPIVDPVNADMGTSVASMAAWAATYTPSRTLEAVLDSYQNAPGATPGTGWGLLNALTYFADHKAGKDADSRLASAWVGGYAQKKQKLLNKLVAMAQ